MRRPGREEGGQVEGVGTEGLDVVEVLDDTVEVTSEELPPGVWRAALGKLGPGTRYRPVRRASTPRGASATSVDDPRERAKRSGKISYTTARCAHSGGAGSR